MSGYRINYTPAAEKELYAAPVDIREDIEAGVRRYANLASNIAGGAHRKHLIPGKTFTATCTICHLNEEIIVIDITITFNS